MKLIVKVNEGKYSFELDHEGERDLEVATSKSINGVAFAAYCVYVNMMDEMDSDVYDDETFTMFATAVNAFLWETYEGAKDEAPLEIKDLDE